MTRIVSLTVVTALLAVANAGCQSTGKLFGQRDLPTAAELTASTNDDETPATATRDLIDRADRDFAAQRYDQARPLYESVLREAPASAHAHHRLAVIADLQSRYSEAEEHYQAALIRDSRNSQILSDLGYSYIMQARFEEAETRLNQARANDPSNRNAAANLALLYAHLGDREKCLAVAKLLGSPEGPEKTVEALFAQAGQNARPEGDSDIQLAGAFDIFRRDRKKPEEAAPQVNGETLDLARRLREAREASIRERQARDAADPRRVPSTRDALNPFAVPNDRINEAMSNIDREPYNANPNSTVRQPPTAWPPRDQPMQPSPNYGATQTPQTTWPQQPATPSGVVTADGNNAYQMGSTQPAAGRSAYPEWPAAQPNDSEIFSQQPTSPQTQLTGGTDASWPTTTSAAPTRNTTQPNAQQPYVSGPGSTGQAPIASSSMDDARRAAAAMGMGAGLGGMFDRYAYKQPQQQSQRSVPQAYQPQPYGQPAVQPSPQTSNPYGSPQYGSTPQPPLGTNSGNATYPSDQSQPSVSQGRQQYGPQQQLNSNTPVNPASQGTTPRDWAGTNSMYGAQYPRVDRQLPTDRPLTPPAISPGMPVPPNWQGQAMPTSTPQLSGPGAYGTTAPSGALAPAPPASSFSGPVLNPQTLPRTGSPQAALNNEFNNLQRRMMGSPNLVPANGPTAFDPQQQQRPTQTGPTNPNVPYYSRSTGPKSGGFGSSAPPSTAQPQPSQTQRQPARSLPPGFVQPPPYNGGATIQPQQPATPAENSYRPAPSNGAQMPQVSPRG